MPRRRGQALVEFALAIPVMLALLIGVIDMAWLMNHQLMLTNASREGARLGALGLSDAEIEARVNAQLQSAGIGTATTITVDASGGESQVTVRSTVPFLFAHSGPAVTLQAETVMRRE